MYSHLHEDLLNTHNRTNDPKKTDYDLFEFTADPKTGYESFRQCFNHWLLKAHKDKDLDLLEVFGVSWDEIKRPPPIWEGRRPRGFMRGRRGRGGPERGSAVNSTSTTESPTNSTNNNRRLQQSISKDNMTNKLSGLFTDLAPSKDALTSKSAGILSTIFHDIFNKEKVQQMLDQAAKDAEERKKWERMSEAEQIAAVRAADMEEEEIFLQYLQLEYLAAIEESMGCAGICRSPLFYFSKSVYSGYPTETCMTKMVEYVQRVSKPVGTISNFIGTILMLLLATSFSLFGKTPPEPEMPTHRYKDDGERQGAEMQEMEKQ